MQIHISMFTNLRPLWVHGMGMLHLFGIACDLVPLAFSWSMDHGLKKVLIMGNLRIRIIFVDQIAVKAVTHGSFWKGTLYKYRLFVEL
jgi:hypothetical protein